MRFFSGRRKHDSTAHSPRKHTGQPARLELEALESRETVSTLYGLTLTNTILRFDSANPTAILGTATIQGLSSGERVVGIDFRPRTGQLFALAVGSNGTGNTARLLTINPLTGVSTQIGSGFTIPVPDVNAQYGFDFNPTVDAIRIVNSADENLRVSPNTGAILGDDANINPAGQAVDAVAYDRNFDGRLGAAGTTLYAINPTTSMLQTQGGLNQSPSPNTGTLINVGPLNITIDATFPVAFDILANGVATSGPAFSVFDPVVTSGLTSALYSMNLTNGAATLIGLVGDGTQAIQGLAATPDNVLVIGSGVGANGDVRILDAFTGQTRTSIVPFAGFQGAVRVATADVNRDSVPDAIVSAVAPQGHVKVFNGATGQQVGGMIGSFFAFEGFQGNVSVAGGDVNGDGFHDVIVAANNANGHVKAFSGADGSVLASFFAYNGFTGNVQVAAADFDNDGDDEIVTTAASNGHVKVFNRDGTPFANPNASFFAFQGFLGDVSVAAGDVNGDGTPDIVVGSGGGTQGHVKAFSGTTGATIASFFAFDSGTTAGANVALADFNQDGRFEFRAAGPQAEVRTFDGITQAQLNSFFASGFTGGISIGGARF